MEIELTSDAKEDLAYWKSKKNDKVLQRIKQLIDSIVQAPFQGIGKPEALKHNLSGKWSRRIDKENRIVYQIKNNTIFVHSLKGHY